MNIIVKISVLLGGGVFLASCSNYAYISENDVYMQTPTEVNLDENENDITSFNAFKAKQNGVFDQEYTDPRINETVRFNQILIMNSYNPYGLSYMYTNGPIAFHGMGWDSRFVYNGFNSGWNIFYYNQMDPFGYGFGYNGMYNGLSYGSGFGNSYYGYGHGYYGNGYYGNIYNNGNNSNSVYEPTYYGNRSTLSSTSNRSSYNPSKSMMSTSSSGVNNQALGDSRRDVQRRNASGSDYSKKITSNGVPIKNNTEVNVSRHINNGSAHYRAMNNSYTPNSSARRSGIEVTQRSSGVTVQSVRGSGSSQVIKTTSPHTPRVQSRQSSYSVSPSSSGSSRSSSPSSTSSSSSRRR